MHLFTTDNSMRRLSLHPNCLLFYCGVFDLKITALVKGSETEF